MKEELAVTRQTETSYARDMATVNYSVYLSLSETKCFERLAIQANIDLVLLVLRLGEEDSLTFTSWLDIEMQVLTFQHSSRYACKDIPTMANMKQLRKHGKGERKRDR